MADDTGSKHRPSGRRPDEVTETGLSRRTFLRSGAAGALGASVAGARSEASGTEEPTSKVRGPAATGVELRVNGAARRLSVEPRVTLLDALRDELRVTGPKRVCDRGTCGACTVLQDGAPIYACSRLAVECEGSDIVTVEGLGSPDDLHNVQRAFVDNDAQQCGFCTPGFIVAFAALKRRHPSPTRQQIEEALGGNLCRCGTYGGMHRVLAQLGDES